MATHSSILAWRMPWMVEPAGLYSPWGCKESDTTERLILVFHSKFYWSYLTEESGLSCWLSGKNLSGMQVPQEMWV